VIAGAREDVRSAQHSGHRQSRRRLREAKRRSFRHAGNPGTLLHIVDYLRVAIAEPALETGSVDFAQPPYKVVTIQCCRDDEDRNAARDRHFAAHPEDRDSSGRYDFGAPVYRALEAD
jgi:hypothetical protein